MEGRAQAAAFATANGTLATGGLRGWRRASAWITAVARLRQVHCFNLPKMKITGSYFLPAFRAGLFLRGLRHAALLVPVLLGLTQAAIAADLELSSTFTITQRFVGGQGTSTLDGIVGHENSFKVVLRGVTTQQSAPMGMKETRVSAQSFELTFFGPDAAVLNADAGKFTQGDFQGALLKVTASPFSSSMEYAFSISAPATGFPLISMDLSGAAPKNVNADGYPVVAAGSFSYQKVRIIDRRTFGGEQHFLSAPGTLLVKEHFTVEQLLVEIALLHDEITAKAAQITNLTQSNSALATQVAQLSADLAKANADLLAANTSVTKLIAEKAAVQKLCDSAVADLNTANLRIAQLTSEVAGLQGTLAANETQLNSAKTQLTLVTAENKKLTTDLGIANGTIGTQAAQIVSMVADNTSLAAQLKAASALNLQLNADLSVARATSASQASQITAQTATIAGQNTTLTTQAGQITTLQAQLAARDGSLATLTTQNAAQAAELTAIKLQNSTLTQTFQTVFNDPTFEVPGTTSAQKTEAIVSAIKQLNPGQQKAVYDNLVPKKVK